MLAAVLASPVNSLSRVCLCPVWMKVIMPVPICSLSVFSFSFFFHSFHGKSQVVKKIITVEQRLEQMLRDSYLSCLKLWTSDLVPLSSSFLMEGGSQNTEC